MYCELLEVAGWQPCPVATGRDALTRLLATPRAHAVIFEFALPDMTGLVLCQEMNTFIGDAPLLRIVVTGWMLSAAQCVTLGKQGVTAIYRKPCDIDALLAALEP